MDLISFGPQQPSMRELMQYTWEIGVQHFVEFFEGIKTKVILVDSYDDLTKYFEIMKKDDFLFIDFEYKPSTKSSPTNYISLYQICYSQGVVVIKQNTKKPSDQLRNFLSKESGNKFIGKGINGDLTKLKQTFGDDFSINLEDIEITRLAPKNESLNFDAMVLKYARKPAADFNDKKITLSNWAAPKLSIAQVVYASFDVVALFYCFPNFSPIRTIPFVAAPYKSCFISNSIRTIPMPKFHRPYSMKHSLLRFYLAKNEVDEIPDIDKTWDENPDLVANLLHIDIALQNKIIKMLGVRLGGKFYCKRCKEGRFVSFASFWAHASAHKLTEKPNKDDLPSMKTLFLQYLQNSGRVSVCEKLCVLCNSTFESEELLENHCWSSHSEILCEWMPCPTVDLSILNENRHVMDAAESFLMKIDGVLFKNNGILCKNCNKRFIDPLSLVNHTLEKHYRIVVSTKEVSKSWHPNPVDELIVCSELYSTGWDKNLTRLFEQVTSIDGKRKVENTFYCEDCSMNLENEVNFRKHCLKNHIIIEPCYYNITANNIPMNIGKL